MTIVPVLIDRRPDYLQCGGAPASLLLTPAATQTLLGYVCEMLKPITSEPVTIITTFESDSGYEAGLMQTGARVAQVTSIDRFDEVLERLEPSDWVLLLDPQRFPQRMDQIHELTRRLSGASGARHLVVLDRSSQGTKEYVQLDTRGNVQRIRRFYDGVTWLQARAVAASLVTAGAFQYAPCGGFSDLGALRATLAQHGVISSDIRLAGGVLDLRSESGLLRLSEYLLADLTNRLAPSDFDIRAPGIWTARDCHIHPTARLFGPVVVGAGARVERDTALIGPVLIGPGSRIGRGAAMTDCLVAPGSVIARKTNLHNRLVCGQKCNGRAATGVQTSLLCADRSTGSLRTALAGNPTNGRERRQVRDAYIALKRVGDGLIALLALIVLAPLLVLTAAAIKLTSRGPVFFKHQREGRHGKSFACYKFRTMVADAHRQQRALYKQNAVDGPQFKLDQDPRLTRLGQWLRVSNVDELPQLFNVVLGQMSLIGPRPSPFRENQICVPWRDARLAVRPGITGLWQICRHQRSAGDFHQWIHYDMLYVQHVSPWIDLKIIALTALTLGGRWSVPVTWLIPLDALRPDMRRHATAGKPLLQSA